MKRAAATLFFLLLLGPSTGARGAFVIPYELRLGPPEKPERYTALAVLADYFGRPFGEPDDLSRLLVQNDHGPGNAFLQRYLPVPYEWYLSQVAAHPQIYGSHAEALVTELRRFHGVDPNVSAVIITEHRRLGKPLALLRVGTAGADGLLPTMHQFNGRGFDPATLPAVVPRMRWQKIASWRAEAHRPDFFDVTMPTNERLHHWTEGGRVEFKNFAMDRATKQKFLRYLYHIAWAHKMFTWGIDGNRVSEVWLGNYGSLLMRLYRSLGFHVWDTIHNEHTWDGDVFLMRATVRGLHRRMKRVAAATLEENRGHRFWLIHDRELSGLLKSPECVEALLDDSLASGRNPR